MNRLRQQLIVKRIKSELQFLTKQDITEIQTEIDDIKKERSGNRTCKPAEDHDQVVEAYLKLQLNDNTKEREDGI